MPPKVKAEAPLTKLRPAIVKLVPKSGVRRVAPPKLKVSPATGARFEVQFNPSEMRLVAPPPSHVSEAALPFRVGSISTKGTNANRGTSRWKNSSAACKKFSKLLRFTKYILLFHNFHKNYGPRKSSLLNDRAYRLKHPLAPCLPLCRTFLAYRGALRESYALS